MSHLQYLMNIYLTADYEIYFGKNQGTVQKCLLYPTQLLIDICKKYSVSTTHFIDVGYIVALQKYSTQFSQLRKDLNLIIEQILKLIKNKHSCQLHIHPHWETAHYDGKSWGFDLNFYKLSDFEKSDAISIVKEYHRVLSEITNSNVDTFRAGGWCVQPFDYLCETFLELGIKIDSSVYVGGSNFTHPYQYNFELAPSKDFWKFQNDPVIEDLQGNFTEIPITSHCYSPLFFWQLYTLGRLNPKNHKSIGDGFPVNSGGKNTWNYLTSFSHLFASMDGYFASNLNKILQIKLKANHQHFTVIGHPKAYTYFSLKMLERFISNNLGAHNFIALNQFKQ